MREYVTEQNLWLCRVLGCAWQPNTLRLEVKTLNSGQISQAGLQLFSRDSDLRNSSVSPSVCLSVCPFVIKLSK